MVERETWYILFVRSGMEENILSFLQKEGYACFIPKKEAIYRHAGRSEIVAKVLFPGYLFITSDLSQGEFHSAMSMMRQKKSGIVRDLKYDNEGTSVLTEEEQDTLEHLLNEDKVLKKSTGMIENDTVIILEGPLKGYESRIVHVDRHKREAILSLQLCTREVQVKVALEVIQKIQTSDS